MPVKDFMTKKLVYVSPDTTVAEAADLLREHHLRRLPVVDNGQLYGIITDRDVFKAFLEIAGYGQEGYRLVILADEGIGVLSKVLNRLSSANLSVKRLVIIERKAGKKAVEIQLEGYADKDVLKQELVFDDVIVETLEKTVKKPLS
ncbi:TPA: CBS domain-containing protein [Streptococcus agalactiae]